MRAVLLAAGVGERLRPFTDNAPKCLLPVGGKSLLARHLDHFAAHPGVSAVGIVTGHLGPQITDAIAAWRAQTGHPMPIDLIDNPRFRDGSLLSLAAARPWLLASDCLVMDADVLYGQALLARLLAAPYPTCVLLDESAFRTGEEMMICTRKRRVAHIARSRESSTWSGFDHIGEGVGFLRLAVADAPALLAEVDALLAAGHPELEYEAALDRFVKVAVAGFERVDDLPWTEIDFPADLARAERDILPRLERRAPAPPPRDPTP